MSHIDRDLLVLVSRAETQFKDQNREKVQRETAVAILEALEKSLQGSNDLHAHEFRKIARARVDQIRQGLESFLDGDGYFEESDHFNYLAEAVDTALFGPDFYAAFNKFERLFSK